jgi:hypothetical protein
MSKNVTAQEDRAVRTSVRFWKLDYLQLGFIKAADYGLVYAV